MKNLLSSFSAFLKIQMSSLNGTGDVEFPEQGGILLSDMCFSLLQGVVLEEKPLVVHRTVPSCSSPHTILHPSPIPHFLCSTYRLLLLSLVFSLGLSCCIYENKTFNYVHLIVVQAQSETSYIQHGSHWPNDFWCEAWALMDDFTLKVCGLWWLQC